jgi:uncharacterized membrane protein
VIDARLPVGDESERLQDMASIPSPFAPSPPKSRPFRRAVFRGLALILPPILTIVIFLWIFGTVQVYVLKPVTDVAREAIVWLVRDVREPPLGVDAKPTVQFDGKVYMRLDSGEYIPAAVAEAVRADIPGKPLPNARAAYEDYVNLRFLRPIVVVPVFILVFVLVLYVLGKLFAAGVGGFIGSVARRLPVVRSVYASVKKVTDFAFVENEVEFKRVVAIEFPRKGIWTVGLVTGEGMLDIAGAAHEPCVTVAVPGSPVPFTGNVVTVPKSAAHDLNITIDEALQFFISCGVVVPSRELREKPAGRESTIKSTVS